MDNNTQAQRNRAVKLLEELHSATYDLHFEMLQGYSRKSETEATRAMLYKKAELLEFIDSLITGTGYSPAVEAVVRKQNKELYNEG